MRNRAKCKKCKHVIESFHRFDYITCECGEISVDGGTDSFKCSARDWGNFIRISDEDEEIPVKVKDEPKAETIVVEPVKLGKRELVQELLSMANSIESLPKHALHSAATQYDLYALIALLVAIFKSDGGAGCLDSK